MFKENVRYGNATPLSVVTMIILFRDQENSHVFNGVIHNVAEHSITENHYDKL